VTTVRVARRKPAANCAATLLAGVAAGFVIGVVAASTATAATRRFGVIGRHQRHR
jgi:hypothetical protein